MALTGSGKDALIYISGTAFQYANNWTFNITAPAGQYASFGDSWKSAWVGIPQAAGSITAWHDQDGKLLKSVVIAGQSVALLIYPKKSDATTYYSCNAVFTAANSTGPLEGTVTETADFISDGTVTLTGFS